jgi:hypothetical protein
MVEINTGIIIIKNVPSQICTQCGEVSYSDTVTKQLEKMIDLIRNTARSELAVINYDAKAA